MYHIAEPQVCCMLYVWCMLDHWYWGGTGFSLVVLLGVYADCENEEKMEMVFHIPNYNHCGVD